MKIILIYNEFHRFLNLKNQIYIKITKIEKSKYYIFNVFNLLNKKIEFFSIKRKINNLIYEINLLTNIRIHKIISIIYLE